MEKQQTALEALGVPTMFRTSSKESYDVSIMLAFKSRFSVIVEVFVVTSLCLRNRRRSCKS